MIVKLTKRGCVNQYVDADSVLEQPTHKGMVDLEITKNKQNVTRVLIGIPEMGHKCEWERAYIMEHGKTVDTIRVHAKLVSAESVRATVNGAEIPITVTQ